jgi:hypothetical protein
VLQAWKLSIYKAATVAAAHDSIKGSILVTWLPGWRMPFLQQHLPSSSVTAGPVSTIGWLSLASSIMPYWPEPRAAGI